jgi:uncharacterized membrane protein
VLLYGIRFCGIAALTDGIFAVVMTLLVLDISVPQISSSHYAIGGAAAGTELPISFICLRYRY